MDMGMILKSEGGINNYSAAHSHRSLTEVELLRTISKITWSGVCDQSAFLAISGALLRLPGFTGFRFEPSQELSHLQIFETAVPRLAVPGGHARAAVRAGGLHWGEIRLFFDPNCPLGVESPLRLAKFLGQQIAMLLERLGLELERQFYLARLHQIGCVVRRRKLIWRAAKSLSNQNKITEKQAITEMVMYARSNRRRVLDVAESVILGCNTGSFTRPDGRRLSRREAPSAKAS